MADFSYRIRFRLPKQEEFGIDVPSWTIRPPTTPTTITLTNREGQKPIKDSRNLAISARGCTSAEEASLAGQRCKDALALTMVQLGSAVDFEERRPHGVFTSVGIAMTERCAGTRVLADESGLMVFETDPPPFAGAIR